MIVDCAVNFHPNWVVVQLLQGFRHGKPLPGPLPPLTLEKLLDTSTQTELEAAAFRRLVSHLRDRSDVQNIDMMNLAGFCRNCLSKWYSAEASERNLDIDLDAAREIIYGMPYSAWKEKYQTEATEQQKEQYRQNHP